MTLEDDYEKLTKRQELYETATRIGRYLGRLGVLIFLIGFLLSLFELFYFSVGLIVLGITLVFFVEGYMERRSGVQDLLASEEEFLNVFEALKDLETYFQEKNAFSYSRIKAAKKITKFN